MVTCSVYVTIIFGARHKASKIIQLNSKKAAAGFEKSQPGLLDLSEDSEGAAGHVQAPASENFALVQPGLV